METFCRFAEKRSFSKWQVIRWNAQILGHWRTWTRTATVYNETVSRFWRMCKLLRGRLNSTVFEPIGFALWTRACVQNKSFGPTINSMFNTAFHIFFLWKSVDIFQEIFTSFFQDVQMVDCTNIQKCINFFELELSGITAIHVVVD